MDVWGVQTVLSHCIKCTPLQYTTWVELVFMTNLKKEMKCEKFRNTKNF